MTDRVCIQLLNQESPSSITLYFRNPEGCLDAAYGLWRTLGGANQGFDLVMWVEGELFLPGGQCTSEWATSEGVL